MIIAPCKDCSERHPGCHADCQAYKTYSLELCRQREKKQAEYNITNALEKMHKHRRMQRKFKPGGGK